MNNETPITLERIEELLPAAAMADWGQVIANGGPPCFHLMGGAFCLRAERWPGHGEAHHKFISLYDLFAVLKQPQSQWQPITREQARSMSVDIGMCWRRTEDSQQTTDVAISRLRELGIEVAPPTEEK